MHIESTLQYNNFIRPTVGNEKIAHKNVLWKWTFNYNNNFNIITI